jgi:hypothetical protein
MIYIVLILVCGLLGVVSIKLFANKKSQSDKPKELEVPLGHYVMPSWVEMFEDELERENARKLVRDSYEAVGLKEWKPKQIETANENESFDDKAIVKQRQDIYKSSNSHIIPPYERKLKVGDVVELKKDYLVSQGINADRPSYQFKKGDLTILKSILMDGIDDHNCFHYEEAIAYYIQVPQKDYALPVPCSVVEYVNPNRQIAYVDYGKISIKQGNNMVNTMVLEIKNTTIKDYLLNPPNLNRRWDDPNNDCTEVIRH